MLFPGQRLRMNGEAIFTEIREVDLNNQYPYDLMVYGQYGIWEMPYYWEIVNG